MTRVDDPIEAEFVFGHRCPDRSAVYQTMERLSEEARRSIDARLDIPFGPHPRERMDLFPAGPDAPMVVFIHGGYWRSQDRRTYDFVAKALRPLGFSVAVPGYPLAPEVTVAEIAASLRGALVALDRSAPDRGASARRLYLAGHSAGGHLAALLASLAATDLGMPSIAGCLAVSGLFDLRPVLRTSINAVVGLDLSAAEACSPLLRVPGTGWLLAAYGSKETNVFKTQADRYVSHWGRPGHQARTLPIADLNHYNILLDLASSDGRIASALAKEAAADRQGARRAVRGDHGQAAVRQL